jgi:hypothetical protein
MSHDTFSPSPSTIYVAAGVQRRDTIKTRGPNVLEPSRYWFKSQAGLNQRPFGGKQAAAPAESTIPQPSLLGNLSAVELTDRLAHRGAVVIVHLVVDARDLDVLRENAQRTQLSGQHRRRSSWPRDGS